MALIAQCSLVCLMLISFAAALGIRDDRSMHYAETRKAQMSLHVRSRRVREKYYGSINKISTQIYLHRKDLHHLRKEAANQETVTGSKEFSSCAKKKKS